MATLFPHYSLAKKIGSERVEIAARDVSELIAEGTRNFGRDFAEELKTAAIMINGRNIIYLKGFKTPLADDDEIFTVIPAAGG